MLESAAIVAFAATSDAEACIKFYRDKLRLTLVSDEPYAVVFDCGGTMLRIQKVDEVISVPYTALGWSVADIDAFHGVLVKSGIAFELFANFGQDERGIMTFPSGAKVGWMKDPDGNLLSVTQLP